MPEEIIRQYMFDRPGQYQIRVLGALDQCWLDHLEDLYISTSSGSGNLQLTHISGWLSNQTALAGLLELLNDLGMVILTVERLEDSQEDNPADDQGIE